MVFSLLLLVLETAAFAAGSERGAAALRLSPPSAVILPGLASALQTGLAQPSLLPAAAAPTNAFIAPRPASVHSGASAAKTAAEPAAGNQLAVLGLEPQVAATAYDGGRKLSVVLAASEAVPYVKTGGLADVVDALARGIAAEGHRVTLFLPKYGGLKFDAGSFERRQAPVNVRIDGRVEQASLWTSRQNGVDVVLIENEGLFGRSAPYGSAEGDYSDNDVRFSFYAQAVLAASAALGLKPDIFHAHDWQAALIPAILKLQAVDPSVSSAKAVMTIHNMAFQGLFPAWSAWKAGFAARDFTYDRVEYHGQFGMLKSGLQFADALTTVSPNYARQIRENEEFGMGLAGLLRYRSRDLHGILNGIDGLLWNPAADPVIHHRYDVDSIEMGKAVNKAAFQRRFNLNADPRAPAFGLVTRFSHQKGIDLIAEIVPEIVRLGGQLFVTGAGDADYLRWLQELQARFPRSVFLNPAFSEDFARLIFAASDFLLMPSRFEPCGLSQMMAQRYGSLPIVTRTGGLLDTVTDVRGDPKGDGLFVPEFSAHGLAETIAAAMALYVDPAALASARANAMRKDTSWGRSIGQYIALYRSLL